MMLFQMMPLMALKVVDTRASWQSRSEHDNANFTGDLIRVGTRITKRRRIDQYILFFFLVIVARESY